MDGTISHTWAVLDVAPPGTVAPGTHGSGAAAQPTGSRGALQALVAAALVAAAIPEVAVVPGGPPERLVLAFAPETAPGVVGGPFLAAVTAGLAAHPGTTHPGTTDRGTSDAATRVAVTLHVGSSDGSFADVVGIADAPVLARVVAAARWSPVVLAASEAWCDEVGAPGASRVRCPGGTFWVRVPGASVVPGLAPSDIAPSSPAAPDRWGGPDRSGRDRSGRDRSDRDRSGRDRSGRDRPGGRTVNLNVQGSVHGDQFAGDKVAGDKVADGGVHHGSRSDDRRPR